jgi:hypothetical protein
MTRARTVANVATNFPEGAWTSYAPTLAVGWANGNGVWSAKYIKFGKTVHVEARFVIGSTTTKGSGLYINLPLAQANVNNVDMSASCDISSTVFPLISRADSTFYFQLYAGTANGTYVGLAQITSTVPATWATGNQFSFNYTYETSD